MIRARDQAMFRVRVGIRVRGGEWKLLVHVLAGAEEAITTPLVNWKLSVIVGCSK